MHNKSTTKSGWLDQIEQARQTWETAVAEIGDTGLEQPGVTGDWTFKDVASHLNGWRELTVDRLEAAAGDGSQPPFRWPDGMSEETRAGVEEINRWFYERDRVRPAAEILAISREQFRRMRDAVAATSEEALLTPGRFPWLGELPLSAVLTGSFEHLYVDHVPEIRDWLTRRSCER
jgi:hypothetical protein